MIDDDVIWLSIQFLMKKPFIIGCSNKFVGYENEVDAHAHNHDSIETESVVNNGMARKIEYII